MFTLDGNGPIITIISITFIVGKEKPYRYE